MKKITINCNLKYVKSKGGMIIRKIKFNNCVYKLYVSTYPDNRMCLRLKNKNNVYEITQYLPDAFIGTDDVLISPEMEELGIIRLLKKERIIRKIISVYNYNYVSFPVAKLNMGKLREYDLNGVLSYQETLMNVQEGCK